MWSCGGGSLLLYYIFRLIICIYGIYIYRHIYALGLYINLRVWRASPVYTCGRYILWAVGGGMTTILGAGRRYM